jgi:hypothetical protein
VVKGLVIFLAALFFSGELRSQDIIVWDSTVKLTWADFAGKADPKSSFDAATVSGIRYKLNLSGEGLTDSVAAVFYKAESWVRRRTEGALIHEQGHFNITEIFARKLRKRIEEFVPRRGDLAHQLNLLYDEIESEREVMESLYDRETRHSADARRQAYWNARIQKELKELEKFAL